MRRWLKIAAITASAALIGIQPAVASPTVGWKIVDTNSYWECGDYVKHTRTFTPGDFGINFKACTVVNSVGGAQAVLVVQNASGLNPWILQKGRVVFESQSEGDVWCAESTLNPGFTRGCYAPTVQKGTCATLDAPRVELTIGGRTEVAYGDYYLMTPPCWD